MCISPVCKKLPLKPGTIDPKPATTCRLMQHTCGRLVPGIARAKELRYGLTYSSAFCCKFGAEPAYATQQALSRSCACDRPVERDRLVCSRTRGCRPALALHSSSTAPAERKKKRTVNCVQRAGSSRRVSFPTRRGRELVAKHGWRLYCVSTNLGGGAIQSAPTSEAFGEPDRSRLWESYVCRHC